MSAATSVFKLSVQSVCQLQQHRIEVSFEMTGLPYQWTPVANHSISIARQSSAQQCWMVLVYIVSKYRTHTMIIQWTEIWRQAGQLVHYLALLTCMLHMYYCLSK